MLHICQVTPDISLKSKEKTSLIKSNTTSISRVISHFFILLGYLGYIQSIQSENKYGESFGKSTFQSLHGQIKKGSDVEAYDRYTSTMRESFVNQRNVKIQTLAELLGVESRNNVYKKVFN